MVSLSSLFVVSVAIVVVVEASTSSTSSSSSTSSASSTSDNSSSRLMVHVRCLIRFHMKKKIDVYWNETFVDSVLCHANFYLNEKIYTLFIFSNIFYIFFNIFCFNRFRTHCTKKTDTIIVRHYSANPHMVVVLHRMCFTRNKNCVMEMLIRPLVYQFDPSTTILKRCNHGHRHSY